MKDRRFLQWLLIFMMVLGGVFYFWGFKGPGFHGEVGNQDLKTNNLETDRGINFFLTKAENMGKTLSGAKRKIIPVSSAMISSGPEPYLLEVRVKKRVGGNLVPAPKSKVYLEKNFSEFYGDEEFCIEESKGGRSPQEDVQKRRKFVFSTNRRGIAFIPLRGGPVRYLAGKTKFRLWAESRGGELDSKCRIIYLDSQGIARIFESGVWSLARGGVDLVLSQKTSICFQVRNQNGEPVPNVPVGLFYAQNGPKRSYSLLLRGASGEGGEGCLRNVKQLLWGGFRKREEEIQNLFLGFMFPRKDISENFYIITEKNFRGAPLKMILPATGKVILRVNDAAGKKIKSGWVALRDPMHRSGHWDDGWVRGPCEESRRWIKRHSVPIKNGEAYFPFVGLGMKIEALVVVPGIVRYKEKEFLGPVLPGEEKIVRINLFPVDPRISLKAFGAGNEILAGTRIRVFFSDIYDLKSFPGCIRHFCESGCTDTLGRLTIPLPPGFSSGEIRQMLLISSGKRGKADFFKLVDLPQPFDSGVYDIGNVVFKPFPLVASGIVSWENKQAAFDAVVVFLRQRIRRGRLEWVPVWRTRTGMDGGFSLSRLWDWEKVKMVSFMEDGSGYSKGVVVDRGRKGVKIILYPSGGVRGKILIEKKEWIEKSLINVWLKNNDLTGEYGVLLPITKELLPDGRFLFKGLPPGIYDFYVTNGFWPGQKIYYLPGIKIVAGMKGTCHDLGSINLKGIFEEVEIDVRGEKGEPLVIKDYFHRPRLIGVPKGHFDMKNGKIYLLKKIGETPTATIKMKGFKEMRIKIDRRHIVVSLRKK